MSESPTLARIQAERPDRDLRPRLYAQALESAIPDLDARIAELEAQLAEAEEAIVALWDANLDPRGRPLTKAMQEAHTRALSRQEVRRERE